MKPEQRNNDFVVSISGINVDMTIVNIEEMDGYCKSRNRLANVVTQKQTYGELEKLNYSLIMNYTKPKPRVVNSKNKPYIDVYGSLMKNYKGGLLIAEGDTLSESITEILLNNQWKENDVDIMVCKDSLSSITEAEMKAANLIRMSADPNFSPDIFSKLEPFYKEKTMSFIICQLFVNEQYELTNKYMDKQSKYYTEQGINEYIDSYELNRQLAFFLYFHVESNKILNIEKPVLIDFLNRMSKAGFIPIPAASIEPYVDIITL